MTRVLKAICALAIVAALTLTLGICNSQTATAANVEHHSAPAVSPPMTYGPQTAVGPASAQGGTTTYGMFGSRTLGQSFVPRSGMFGGGFQTGTTVNFINAGQAGGSVAVPPQLPAPQSTVPQNAANPEFANAAFHENGGEDLRALQQALGTIASIERRAAWAIVPPQTAAARPQPYTRSPELSALMTRIARAKNMLAGPGIEVYMSNNVARVQGAVRTRADGVLLLNVLFLEPQVQQIDNWLVVGTPVSN